MAMGIVSDDLLEAELNNLNKPIPKPVSIVPLEKGRGKGNTEVPNSLRKVISEEAINGTPAKAIEAAFGVSQSSISAYKEGNTSTAGGANPELKSHNNQVRDRIVNKARKKLLTALDNITAEKLASAKLRDVAGVASAMASVIDKVEQKDDAQVKIDKLMIYAPRMRDEQSYEVIEVRE